MTILIAYMNKQNTTLLPQAESTRRILSGYFPFSDVN